MMQTFVVNRHGRLVFPSHFQRGLDFSVIETEEQLDRVIRRDFETIPSTSSWLTGQLGMLQTNASIDLIAACAEKFSDQIGTVRPSRMIFGDRASGIVIGPAPGGERGYIDLLPTYTGGRGTRVNSIDSAIVAPTHQPGQAPTTDYREQPADQPAQRVGLGSNAITTAFGV